MVPSTSVQASRSTVYADRPDPIAFVPIAVSTLGRLCPDFIRLLFLHSHRAAYDLANVLRVSSIRSACFANRKGSIGLTLPST